MDALTDQSIDEVTAVSAARPAEGPAPAAMERVVRAAWQVIGAIAGWSPSTSASPGAMNPSAAERALLRTGIAALASHRR
jgi:hypothetical protein